MFVYRFIVYIGCVLCTGWGLGGWVMEFTGLGYFVGRGPAGGQFSNAKQQTVFCPQSLEDYH